jgi:hypothetical protein
MRFEVSERINTRKSTLAVVNAFWFDQSVRQNRLHYAAEGNRPALSRGRNLPPFGRVLDILRAGLVRLCPPVLDTHRFLSSPKEDRAFWDRTCFYPD